MTPAENPKEADKNLVLALFAKKAIALPIPVESPAISVNINPNTTLSNSIYSRLLYSRFIYFRS